MRTLAFAQSGTLRRQSSLNQKRRRDANAASRSSKPDAAVLTESNERKSTNEEASGRAAGRDNNACQGKTPDTQPTQLFHTESTPPNCRCPGFAWEKSDRLAVPNFGPGTRKKQPSAKPSLAPNGQLAGEASTITTGVASGLLAAESRLPATRTLTQRTPQEQTTKQSTVSGQGLLTGNTATRRPTSETADVSRIAPYRRTPRQDG